MLSSISIFLIEYDAKQSINVKTHHFPIKVTKMFNCSKIKVKTGLKILFENSRDMCEPANFL